MKRFPMSLDAMARMLPWLIPCIVIGAGVIPAFAAGARQGGLLLSQLAGVIILVLLLVFTYLYRPLALMVDQKGITIERRLKPVVISFDVIKSVTQLMPGEMRTPIRTFGNGGLFGYTGKYYSGTFGAMTFYCTRRGNYVLIQKTDGKKIVVTPDDPIGFVQELYIRKPALRTAA